MEQWSHFYSSALRLRLSDSLGIDDLGKAVSPDAALWQGARLEEGTLLARPQGPHPQTRLELLLGDAQKGSRLLEET